MFGYIVVNKPELKIREFETYHSYYCGLCRALQKGHGRTGQLTLSYDMTFLVILLTALYEPNSRVREARCPVHPLRKHKELTNLYSDYVADMNLLLTYYKLADDWLDEKKWLRRTGAAVLHSDIRRIEARYLKKAKLVRDKLEEIHVCEEQQDPNPDRAAGLFGEIMAELFVYQQDAWERDLRTMGFYLGKFIYLMDAYDDREQDRKTGNYNVFLLNPQWNEEGIRESLMLMMTQCARAFERLPVLQDAELIRNILYSGVWGRYKAIQQETKQEKVQIDGNESL